MKGAALERELEKTMNTLFFQLPHIIFPQKLPTPPGGSRDSENFNLRHKSRDEIFREMIDEGYCKDPATTGIYTMTSGK